MTSKLLRYSTLAAVALGLAACSTSPPRNDELESARAAVERVESSADAGEYAAAEVTAAHEALREADRIAGKKGSVEEIRQLAYLARRHADIAGEQISRGQAEKRAADAENQRERAILQARQRESEERERAARQAAEQAQRDADMLKDQLKELQAKQTDRGLVLTLGDVLFDSGQATLKPGAMGTIERLARFLQESPDRGVTIEGHTDSVGTDSYNMELSENRARAVGTALSSNGIPADRFVVVGKGESTPVAGNDSAAGRQQNRRVEIIVSNLPAVAGQ